MVAALYNLFAVVGGTASDSSEQTAEVSDPSPESRQPGRSITQKHQEQPIDANNAAVPKAAPAVVTAALASSLAASAATPAAVEAGMRTGATPAAAKVQQVEPTGVAGTHCKTCLR